jgi:hypothetical protein
MEACASPNNKGAITCRDRGRISLLTRDGLEGRRASAIAECRIGNRANQCTRYQNDRRERVCRPAQPFSRRRLLLVEDDQMVRQTVVSPPRDDCEIYRVPRSPRP